MCIDYTENGIIYTQFIEGDVFCKNILEYRKLDVLNFFYFFKSYTANAVHPNRQRQGL